MRQRRRRAGGLGGPGVRPVIVAVPHAPGGPVDVREQLPRAQAPPRPSDPVEWAAERARWHCGEGQGAAAAAFARLALRRAREIQHALVSAE